MAIVEVVIEQVGKDFFDLFINKVAFDVIKAKELSNVRSGKAAAVIVEVGTCYSLDHIKAKESPKVIEYKPEDFFGDKNTKQKEITENEVKGDTEYFEHERQLLEEYANMKKETDPDMVKKQNVLRYMTSSELFGDFNYLREDAFQFKPEENVEASKHQHRNSDVVKTSSVMNRGGESLFATDNRNDERRYSQEKFDIFDFSQNDTTKSTPFD